MNGRERDGECGAGQNRLRASNQFVSANYGGTGMEHGISPLTRSQSV